MGVILLMVLTFVGYIVAYHTYGRWLARRIFKVREACIVPSQEFEDGIDYVPTSRAVVFGHHFTSIAGTGPIVGPAIAIIWGWAPAIIWVVVGSIFMGAVHDFGSIIVSLRNQGKSIGDVARRYINPRVQLLMFGVIFLELLIVIAIFGLVIAVLFAAYEEAVIPVWAEVPIAVALGWAVAKKRWNVALMTVLAVSAMYATVVLGHFVPVEIDSVLPEWLPATGAWTILLLAYAYIASTLPVTTLLQPRDYINAWQLFIAMGLLVIGVVVSGSAGGMEIVAPDFQPHPEGAPSIWPFLFVTIACGAISGFHSLVASGTSSKQLNCERDALPVGFGSMLMEAALATLVIIAVAAGVGLAHDVQLDDGGLERLEGVEAWKHYYPGWLGGAALTKKIAAFVEGSGGMIAGMGIGRPLAVVIMGVFLASFAGTTLDTATRLQRYVIGELATRVRAPVLGNRYVATAIAVITAGAVAFSSGLGGAGAMRLWPMFGSLNQLLAALALLVITVYLRHKGGAKFLITGIPCLFMLVMTVWAMLINERDFLFGENTQSALLATINGITLVLATWMVIEVAVTFKRKPDRILPDGGERPGGPSFATETTEAPGGDSES